jgi:hypothetical protein
MAEKAAAQAAEEPTSKAKVSKEVQALVSEKKAKTEAKAKAQYEREWRANLVADAWVSIRDDADVKPFTMEVHRYLAVRAARNLSTDDATRICELLSLGKVAPGSAVVDYARETPSPDMLHLLILMQESSAPNEHSYNGRVPNEGLMLIAGKVFEGQLETVINEIKGEVKDKIWPKVAKTAKIATAPAARPEAGAGGGDKVVAAGGKKPPAARAKLSAEDAISGIAKAMQSIKPVASAKAVAPQPSQMGLAVGFAIGQTVQVTSDSDKFGSRLSMNKWLGKRGRISGRAGKAWDVTFKGRSGGIAAFDEDEISLVEGVAA